MMYNAEIELSHPESGQRVTVQTERQATILEKSGWVRANEGDGIVTEVQSSTDEAGGDN